MQTTPVRCGNPNCGRVLDEPSSLAPSEREPCPDCGSLARVFEKTLTARVRVSASIARTKIHEEIERHWRWILVGLALTAAGAVSGYFIGGMLGVFVGVVLGLIGIPVAERSVTHVREIEHSGGN